MSKINEIFSMKEKNSNPSTLKFIQRNNKTYSLWVGGNGIDLNKSQLEELGLEILSQINIKEFENVQLSHSNNETKEIDVNEQEIRKIFDRIFSLCSTNLDIEIVKEKMLKIIDSYVKDCLDKEK